MAPLKPKQKAAKANRRLPVDTDTVLTPKQVGIVRSMAGVRPPFTTIASLAARHRRRLRARLGGPLIT